MQAVSWQGLNTWKGDQSVAAPDNLDLLKSGSNRDNLL